MNNSDGFKIGGVFEAVCYGPDGKEKWTDTAKNLITNVGLDHVLDVVLHGTSATSPWYVGLKNVGTIAAADTLATQAGWAENENYTGGRQEYVEAAASSQSVTNAASKASFSITAASQTIAGAFLASAATGSSGILLCAANFTDGNKDCGAGDKLEISYVIGAADA